MTYIFIVMMYSVLLQASEFQSAVNSLRDFLPQAEQELKFQPLPEHELAIMQLMERHEKFEDQLQVCTNLFPKIIIRSLQVVIGHIV